jgi:prevent-host-death family protein
MTTISSRDFNQDTARAKKAAIAGPVFITDRGRPAHVLLSIDEYNRLVGSQSLAEAMEQIKDPNDDFDFEPAPLAFLAQDIDLS